MRAHEFIRELVNPELRNTKKTVPHDLTGIARRVNYDSNINSGMYGAVKDTPNDPATVTKTIYNTEMNPDTIDAGGFDGDYTVDAYYLWVKASADSGMMGSNPYIPRVYVIDDREDSRGVMLPRYRIEKLHPVRSAYGKVTVSVYVLEAWLNQLSPDYCESFESQIQGYIKNDDKVSLWGCIQNLLRYSSDYLSDQQAIDAVGLIYKILSWDDDLTNDMHTGNFMYRLTSVGPQLVITDPISGELRLSSVKEFLNKQEWK